MIATNELRFVERTVKTPYGNDGAEVSKNVRILQQKWQERYWTFDEAGNKSQPEEWRDVPLAKEDTA
jgi:hypothetical protein